MYNASDLYMKGENLEGVNAEIRAYTLISALKGEKIERVKTTMLSPSKLNKIQQLGKEDSILQKTLQSKQSQMDQYMNKYYQTIRDKGIQEADKTKEDYAAQLEKAKTEYRQTKVAFDSEVSKIKKSFPERMRNYENAKLEDTSEDQDQSPIVGMNKVITDISIAYPDYSYSAGQLNQQIHLIHENYNIDLSYSTIVNDIMVDLSNNVLTQVERDLNYKKKQMDIQEYYDKNYQQQIILFKVLLIFSLLALFGGLLLNYQWISLSLFTVYLGTVLAVGFIVMFYFLWDFYLRDNTNFDEYDFVVYNPPPKPAMAKDTNQFKDNIIYC